MSQNLHTQLLDDLVNAIGSNNSLLDELVKKVRNAFQLLTEKINSNGEYTDDLNIFISKKIDYEWSEEAKQLGILLRDIVLRNLKDRHKLLDHKVSDELRSQHREEEVSILREAWNSVFESYEEIQQVEKVDDSFIEKWKHQLSPKEVILNQMVLLQNQLDTISAGNENLIQLREDIKTNQSRIKDNFIWINDACDRLKDHLAEAKKHVQKIESDDPIKRMGIAKVELDKIYKKVERSRPQPPNFNFESTNKGVSIIPTSVIEGQLVVKEINFADHINAWIESDLYPSYLDEKSIIDGQFDNVLITIFNIRNRISVLETDDVDDLAKEVNSLLIPLNRLDELLTETDDNVEAYSEQILLHLDDAMQVSKVFDTDKIFFPSNGQVKYLDLNRGRRWLDMIQIEQVLSKIKYWVRGLFIDQSDSGNALTSTIQYTDDKRLIDESQQSKSLFFNKGYLGKSFYIHRPLIEQKISNTYEYWKKGFGGSVLLHGSRLSGKSSILDALHDIIVDVETVKLKPGIGISYLGRKFEPGYNLKSALDFLIKHSISKKLVVLIDDLELWRGDGVSFYENMVSLQDSISKFGRRMFIVVATNHWMKIHLDNHMRLSNSFIVRIATNQMRINDIISAIKIRHAATYHGSLLDQDDQKREQSIHQKAKKISLANNGNIGASLKEWGRNTALYNSEVTEYQSIMMPSDVRSHLVQYRLIFTHLFRFKQTSEKELRNMIGDTFVREVNQSIQSLIGLGILKRSISGVLAINEMVIHEIEDLLLEQKGKLNYQDE